MEEAGAKRTGRRWGGRTVRAVGARMWRFLPPLITDEPEVSDLPRFRRRDVVGLWIGDAETKPPQPLPTVIRRDPLVRILHDAYVSGSSDLWIGQEPPSLRVVLDLAGDTRITFLFSPAYPSDQALVRVRRPNVGAREWHLRSRYLADAARLVSVTQIVERGETHNRKERSMT